jgi:hypothetical protein
MRANSTWVRNAAAGRTDTSMRCAADLPPELAVNSSVPEPSKLVALTRKVSAPSCIGASDSFCVLPITCNCGPVLSVTVTGIAALAAPAMLFDTPTPTSASSPGASVVGALGDNTKSPRTVVAPSTMPIMSGDTATAITRSLPWK